MRILVVNVNAYTSSTGKITMGLYNYLKENGHEVMVCYRGTLEEKVDNPDFVALGRKWRFYISVFLSRLTGLEGHFNFFGTNKLFKLIKYFNPDVIQLYNIHGNYVNSYKLLSVLKAQKRPVVYSMVDEFPYMGKCPFPVECEKFKTECGHCPQLNQYPISWFFDTSRLLFNKKKNIYEGFDSIVFTGPPFVCSHTKEAALMKGQRVLELDEPFSFKEYYYPHDTEKLRKELGISKIERVIVCASGTLPRKGGHFFIDIAKKVLDEPNFRLIFIGYDRNDWTFPENVIVKGFISNQGELADYMSLADAYVCTSVGDTTPSVCLGALGCGTPLIGFDYGGVVDCAPNKFGTYVPVGDIDAMAQAVKNTRKKTQKDIDEIRAYAVGRFSPDAIYNKQVEIYKSIISK